MPIPYFNIKDFEVPTSSRRYPASKTGDILPGGKGHVLGDRFALDVEKFKNKSFKKIETMVRKIALNLYKEIIRTSPVDTGLFRANNQMDVDKMNSSKIYAERPPKRVSSERGVVIFDAGPTIVKGESSLNRFKLGSSIYLFNNLVYAQPLEFGHSGQAPLGIYRQAVLNSKRFVRVD
jgi:hypothetical protein